MTRVVVAPDAFKGSLTAIEATAAIARGIARARPDVACTLLPMADGGEGTVDAFLGSAGWRAVVCDVHDPFGRAVRATFAFDGVTAVCEMATASGFAFIDAGETRGARDGSSVGTGELLRAALDCDATRIVLGVGGTATNDGGAGALTALGARFYDGHDRPIAPGGAQLKGLVRVDLSALDPRLRSVRIDVATDVDHPLLGKRGASAVFGPQKGATPQDIAILEAALSHFSAAVIAAGGVDARAEPGTGAGGGLPFALRALANARIAPGFGIVAQARGLAAALDGAAHCFTGEGSIDGQTLGGKVVAGVARLAQSAGIRTTAFGGRVDTRAAHALEVLDCSTCALSHDDELPQAAMHEAAERLTRAAEATTRTLRL